MKPRGDSYATLAAFDMFALVASRARLGSGARLNS